MEYGTDRIDPSLAILTSSIDPSEWTSYEDTRLTNIVNQIGPYAWHDIATVLGTGRHANECQHRWRNVLSFTTENKQPLPNPIVYQQHPTPPATTTQFHQPRTHTQPPSQFGIATTNGNVATAGNDIQVGMNHAYSNDIIVNPSTSTSSSSHHAYYSNPSSTYTNDYLLSSSSSTSTPYDHQHYQPIQQHQQASSSSSSSSSSSHSQPIQFYQQHQPKRPNDPLSTHHLSSTNTNTNLNGIERRKEWTEEEDNRLNSIVATNPNASWNWIAQVLNSNRSGTECCTRFGELKTLNQNHLSTMSNSSMMIGMGGMRSSTTKMNSKNDRVGMTGKKEKGNKAKEGIQFNSNSKPSSLPTSPLPIFSNSSSATSTNLTHSNSTLKQSSNSNDPNSNLRSPSSATNSSTVNNVVARAPPPHPFSEPPKGAKWSSSEDEIMTRLRYDHPNWSWREIGKELGRTGGSVRARWAVRVKNGEVKETRWGSHEVFPSGNAGTSASARGLDTEVTGGEKGGEDVGEAAGRNGPSGVGKEVDLAVAKVEDERREERAASTASEDSEKSRSGGPTTSTSDDGQKKKEKARLWTKTEDDELKSLMSKFGKNNWKLIGEAMSMPRSETSVSSRWYKHLQQRDSASNSNGTTPKSEASTTTTMTTTATIDEKPWTELEDELLINSSQLHGTSTDQSWVQISSILNDRSIESCQTRLNQLVKPSLSNSNEEQESNTNTPIEDQIGIFQSRLLEEDGKPFDFNSMIDPNLNESPFLNTTGFETGNGELDLEALFGRITNGNLGLTNSSTTGTTDEAALNLMILETLQSGVGGNGQSSDLGFTIVDQIQDQSEHDSHPEYDEHTVEQQEKIDDDGDDDDDEEGPRKKRKV